MKYLLDVNALIARRHAQHNKNAVFLRAAQPQPKAIATIRHKKHKNFNP